MGLLYGEGDYEKAITRTVLACFDTDCNGATVGSIMGMMLGAKALPEKWTGVMNDTIHTDLHGLPDNQVFRSLPRRCFKSIKVCDKFKNLNGRLPLCFSHEIYSIKKHDEKLTTIRCYTSKEIFTTKTRRTRSFYMTLRSKIS